MSSASPWHWPDIDFDPIPDLEINSLPDGFELQILDRLCFPDPHVLVQTDHSPQPLHTKTKDQHQYSVCIIFLDAGMQGLFDLFNKINYLLGQD